MAAPRSELYDGLYDWLPPEKGEPLRNMITEFESVFETSSSVVIIFW